MPSKKRSMPLSLFSVNGPTCVPLTFNSFSDKKALVTHSLNRSEQQTSKWAKCLCVVPGLLFWGRGNKGGSLLVFRCYRWHMQSMKGRGGKTHTHECMLTHTPNTKHTHAHTGTLTLGLIRVTRENLFKYSVIVSWHWSSHFVTSMAPFSSSNFHRIKCDSLENIVFDWRIPDWRWGGGQIGLFLTVPHYCLKWRTFRLIKLCRRFLFSPAIVLF